jgi:hypothetical protein
MPSDEYVIKMVPDSLLIIQYTQFPNEEKTCFFQIHTNYQKT